MSENEEKIAWSDNGVDYLENGELTTKSKNLVEIFEEALKKADEEASPFIKQIQAGFKGLKEVSEKYGVPMNIGCSEVSGNGYRPGNTPEKFPDVPEEYIKDRCGLYGDYIYLDSKGWQHSSICY